MTDTWLLDGARWEAVRADVLPCLSLHEPAQEHLAGRLRALDAAFAAPACVVSSAESCRRARAARPCAPPEQHGDYSGRGRWPITFWPTNADIRRAW